MAIVQSRGRLEEAERETTRGREGEGREGGKMEWEEKRGKRSMERDDTQLMFGIVMTSSSSPCCVSGRWSSTVDRNWETVSVAYLFLRSIFRKERRG